MAKVRGSYVSLGLLARKVFPLINSTEVALKKLFFRRNYYFYKKLTFYNTVDILHLHTTYKLTLKTLHGVVCSLTGNIPTFTLLLLSMFIPL